MLVRLRADPAKVRVAVRRVAGRWAAYITPRDGYSPCFQAEATGARKALVKALRLADAFGLDGVDLGLGWAYEHPHHHHG